MSLMAASHDSEKREIKIESKMKSKKQRGSEKKAKP